MFNLFKLLAAGCAGALLTACGSTGGVMKLGPDTYTVSASKHYTSGGAVAKTNALEAANMHCIAMGKELLVGNMTNSHEPPFYTSSVNFNCFSKGDPQLTRPTYRPAPNVLIENTTR